MNDSARKYLPLIGWIILLEAIGGAIGMMTAANIDNWYASLNHAPLNPPDWAFGVVWPLLYILIAIAGWRLYTRRHQTDMKPLLVLYGLQLVMNWGWSFVFFSAQLLWPSFIWIMAMVGVVGALMLLARKHDPVTSWLLLPYLLWISFASYLAGYIALFNM